MVFDWMAELEMEVYDLLSDTTWQTRLGYPGLGRPSISWLLSTTLIDRLTVYCHYYTLCHASASSSPMQDQDGRRMTNQWRPDEMEIVDEP